MLFVLLRWDIRRDSGRLKKRAWATSYDGQSVFVRSSNLWPLQFSEFLLFHSLINPIVSDCYYFCCICNVWRIRIWDTREHGSTACKLTVKEAHKSDINVISWNRREPFIVSGGDDGFLNIWDLRNFEVNSYSSFRKNLLNFTLRSLQ